MVRLEIDTGLLMSTSECARNRRDSSSSTQSEYSQKSDRYSKEFSAQGSKQSESERGGNEKMDRGEVNSRDQDDGNTSSGGSLPICWTFSVKSLNLRWKKSCKNKLNNSKM